MINKILVKNIRSMETLKQLIRAITKTLYRTAQLRTG